MTDLRPVLGAAGTPPDAPYPAAEVFRRRLLEGLRRSIEERGYRDTTIADVVRHARASRRTFYRVFVTKDGCLLALMEAANLSLMQRITDAVDPHALWPVQARQAVAAYIDYIASGPGLSLCWIREFPSLGPAAGRTRRTCMNALADLVQRLSDTEPFRRDGKGPVSRELALVILGGLRELTATVLEEGGDVRDAQEVAVAATVALLGASSPARSAPVTPPQGRPRAASASPGVLTDEQWVRIRPLLPPVKGALGRPQVPHRHVVEAIIYRNRAGIPWRDLPTEFGPWQTAWKRHRRWANDGTWDRVLGALHAHGPHGTGVQRAR